MQEFNYCKEYLYDPKSMPLVGRKRANNCPGTEKTCCNAQTNLGGRFSVIFKCIFPT